MASVRQVQVTFDCADPNALAGFAAYTLLEHGGDGKSAKNRLHLDVRAAPGLQGDERVAALTSERDRLVALGATEDGFEPPDPPVNQGHYVMQDPQGNEFCLD